MFAALAPSVLAVHFKESLSDAQERFFLSVGISEYPDVKLHQTSFFDQHAMNILTMYPKDFATVAATSIVTFFTHDGVLELLGSMGFQTSYTDLTQRISHVVSSKQWGAFTPLLFSPLPFIAVVRIFWFATTMLFFWIIIRSLWQGNRSPLLLFYTIVIVFFCITTIANGFAVNARFRFPVQPLLLSVVLLAVASWNQNSTRDHGV